MSDFLSDFNEKIRVVNRKRRTIAEAIWMSIGGGDDPIGSIEDFLEQEANLLEDYLTLLTLLHEETPDG